MVDIAVRRCAPGPALLWLAGAMLALSSCAGCPPSAPPTTTEHTVPPQPDSSAGQTSPEQGPPDAAPVTGADAAPAESETAQERADRRCPAKRFRRLDDQRIACPLGTWVGETLRDRCPDPAAGSPWQGSNLFRGRSGPRDAALRPDSAFCVYEWTGVGPPDLCSLPDDPAIPPATEARVAGAWLDRDCAVVGPSGGLDPVFAGYARERLRATLSQLEIPAVPVTSTIDPTPGGEDAIRPPLVVVLDTAGPVVSDPPLDWEHHALAVHGLARAVACQSDAANCAADFQRILALPAPPPGDRWAFARQARDLATAIDQATSEWRASQAGSSPRSGMIINLSLGWDARFTPANEDNPGDGSERVAVRAVRAALRNAVCAGALVFAAAGNPVLERGAGPIYPAAWEGNATVSSAACGCWEECLTPAACAKCPNFPGGPDAGPLVSLVHAVGAIDDAGRELASARPNGAPRLAAPGLLVGSPVPEATPIDLNGQDPLLLPILTGTSMSTAIVSGVAAAVWAANPQYKPGQVIVALFQGAWPLEIEADFCAPRFNQGCGPARRVSFCRAVMSGFPANGGAGPAAAHRAEFAAQCDAARWTAPTESDSLAGWPQELATALSGRNDVTRATFDPVTADKVAAPETSAATDPSIAPQPVIWPCTGCDLSYLSAILTIVTDATLPTVMRASSVTVTFRTGGPDTISLSRALSDPLLPNRVYIVSGLTRSDGTALTGVSTATLNWNTGLPPSQQYTTQLSVTNR